MSLFDQVFRDTLPVDGHILSEPVTINGHDCRGVVGPIQQTNSRAAGVKVTSNQFSVHIDHDTFTTSGVAKGSIVTTQDSLRGRVMQVIRLGGAGYELICEQPDQAAGSSML